MKTSYVGFTIIELITVVTITAIISIVSVSVLVNSQVRGTRATTINRVRSEGAFILDRTSFLLRNARYLEQNQDGEICQPGMQAIRLRTAEGGVVELYTTDDSRVASNSGTVISNPPASYLSSQSIQVDSLIFSCEQTPEQSGAIITINLTISTGNPDTLSPESYYQETFTTQVYVRSYQ